MIIFLIVLGVLLITNVLLLQFSCNDTAEAEYTEDD